LIIQPRKPCNCVICVISIIQKSIVVNIAHGLQ